MLAIGMIVGTPLVIGCLANREFLWDWWVEWRVDRSYRTYRFVVTAYPDEETQVELPVWFEERDFGDAVLAALRLQERLFAPWILVAISAVDRTWSYIREPEQWTCDIREELMSRVGELLDVTGACDDLELRSDLLEVIERLLLVHEGDASEDEVETAWAIAEEDIGLAFERADAR